MQNVTLIACFSLALATRMLSGCDDSSVSEVPAPDQTCSAGLVVVLEAPDGAATSLEAEGPSGEHITAETRSLVRCNLAQGDWTVKAHLKGYRARQQTVSVGSDVAVVTLGLEPTGEVFTATDSAREDITSLRNMRGETVDADWGFPEGIYELPSPADHFVVVRPGRVTTAHVADSFDAGHSIVVAGLRFPLDMPIKVVRFDQADGLSFAKRQAETPEKNKLHTHRRIPETGQRLRVNDLWAQRRLVTSVMLHADKEQTSKEDFESLAKERLSCHFMIDFDGTLYQGLDTGWQAFHGGRLNNTSLCIDLNNASADLTEEPDAMPFDPKHPRAAEMNQHPRPKPPLGRINRQTRRTYGYTKAQYETLGSLLRLLVAIYPRIKPDFPRTKKGQLRRRIAPDVESFEGIMGHFHSHEERFDPGPGFDWARLERLLALEVR